MAGFGVYFHRSIRKLSLMAFENKHILNLQPYKVASHKIWEVEPSERSNVLKLDWNEATIPPSPLVQKRILELVSGPSFYNLYPATHSEILHEKLCVYAGVKKENLQYFPSSDALHEYISTVFLSERDTVLLLGPTYDNFRLTCESHGARTVYFNYTEDFELNQSQFEDEIHKNAPKLVYICNPNNPTGNLISADYIQHLLVKFSDILFLIDEAYTEFSGHSVKDLTNRFSNILITRTLSKAFALANFRIGYLISSEEIIRNISKIRNPKNFTTFSQEATIAALSDVEYMRNYVEEVKIAKLKFINFLNENGGRIKPFNGHGNFILIKFETDEIKNNFIEFMELNNIFLRNLTHSTLLNKCLRITIGNIQQMQFVQDKITEFWQKN